MLSIPKKRLDFRSNISSDELSAPREVKISPCVGYKIIEVDPRYLSLSIDISVLAGGSWWEGSQKVKKGLGANRVEPLNLNQEKLDRYTKALGSFYLRLGGSEADTIDYIKETSHRLVLTRDSWDQLHSFVQRNDLKLYFTAKYGLFNRRRHGNWESQELEYLLQYSRSNDFTIDAIELGNELNAYWIFHGLTAQPGPKNLAKDYLRFYNAVKKYYPDIKISGPGSAFWPRLGEPITPFSNITRSFLANMREPLDIVDWHYYPFQSTRSPVRTRSASVANMTSARSFNDFEKYSTMLNTWREEFHPEAELWTGESGSAQCGGEPGLSDRWASSFWWADQLGLGAKLGQRVMVRQSLIGGEYGLLDRNTLAPRPDYWVSLMWKHLMGKYVYPVKCDATDIRVYCHENDQHDKTVMIINLSNEVRSVNVHALGKVQKQFELSAPSLQSDDIFINEKSAKSLTPEFTLDDLPNKHVSMLVKPYSINFWQLRRNYES